MNKNNEREKRKKTQFLLSSQYSAYTKTYRIIIIQMWTHTMATILAETIALSKNAK